MIEYTETFKVKFLIQKRENFIKSSKNQQRHEIAANFIPIYLTDVRKDCTLLDLRKELMEELVEFKWLPQNFAQLCFINRGSKIIRNAENTETLDQAIAEDEILGDIFREYEIFETIKIEIVPRMVNVRFESIGLKNNVIFQLKVKIYGRMDDIYIDGGYYVPLFTNWFIHKNAFYINLFGDQEDMEHVMKKNFPTLKNANNKDELMKTIVLREICIPFYNLNANFYETIVCFIEYEKSDSSSYFNGMNSCFQNSLQFYLNQVSPEWKKSLSKVKGQWKFFIKDFSVFKFGTLKELFKFNTKKILDESFDPEETDPIFYSIGKKYLAGIVENIHKTHLKLGSLRMDDLYRP